MGRNVYAYLESEVRMTNINLHNHKMLKYKQV